MNMCITIYCLYWRCTELKFLSSFLLHVSFYLIVVYMIYFDCINAWCASIHIFFPSIDDTHYLYIVYKRVRVMVRKWNVPNAPFLLLFVKSCTANIQKNLLTTSRCILYFSFSHFVYIFYYRIVVFEASEKKIRLRSSDSVVV